MKFVKIIKIKYKNGKEKSYCDNNCIHRYNNIITTLFVGILRLIVTQKNGQCKRIHQTTNKIKVHFSNEEVFEEYIEIPIKLI